MKKKLSPRAAFIEAAVKGDIRRLAAYAWDIGQLAMTHDPDLDSRIGTLEHKVSKLDPTEYRTLYQGKPEKRKR